MNYSFESQDIQTDIRTVQLHAASSCVQFSGNRALHESVESVLAETRA